MASGLTAQHGPLADPLGALGASRRKPALFSTGRMATVAGIGLALILGYLLLTRETVRERPNEMKTTKVVLPPPPPPPPPPEPKPEEKPPEPTPAPPIEQPQETPPPPTPQAEPSPGDNALTAREGAGPSSYGLAAGDGSGTRIGGKPGGGGGNAFAAYASAAVGCLSRAAQRDRELSRGRYTVQLAVTVGADGRITRVRDLSGQDAKRSARLSEVLTGLQCQVPPAGLPVMRVELSARSGA